MVFGDGIHAKAGSPLGDGLQAKAGSLARLGITSKAVSPRPPLQLSAAWLETVSALHSVGTVRAAAATFVALRDGNDAVRAMRVMPCYKAEGEGKGGKGGEGGEGGNDPPEEPSEEPPVGVPVSESSSSSSSSSGESDDPPTPSPLQPVRRSRSPSRPRLRMPARRDVGTSIGPIFDPDWLLFFELDESE